MTYTITTQDGKGESVNLTTFKEVLERTTHYRYATEDNDTLFPYCEVFTNYRIVMEDGTEHCFTKEVYFELVKAQNQHRDECKAQGMPFKPQFYDCSQDKHWTLIPPTPVNRELSALIRNTDRTESNDKSRESRCYDYVNNVVCRYVLDENGKRVKGANGKAIPTKCTDCPRRGWIGGSKLNCCMRHICKVDDCSRCCQPNCGGVPQSLGSFNIPQYVNPRKRIEQRQFLQMLFDGLTDEEKAYFKAVLVMEMDLADYARKLQEATPDTRLATIQQRLYRIRDNIRDKAIKLKNKNF